MTDGFLVTFLLVQSLSLPRRLAKSASDLRLLPFQDWTAVARELEQVVHE